MPDFRWSEQTGRFRGPNGRFLSSQQVRRIIDATLLSHTNAVTALTEQLRGRALALPEWERRMRAEIKGIHVYSSLAALGGRAHLTQSALGRIGAAVKRQYRYLRRLADQLASGVQRMDGTLISRARLYVAAGRGTLEATRRRDMERRGFTEVRSILRPAEHCGTCVEQAGKSWQSPSTFIPIGARECIGNCRCFSEWRNPETGEIAA